MKGLRNIGWMYLAWTFFSCTSDLDITQGGTAETDGEGAYFVLEVTAATGTSTRSNPTGGEPGDGSETGLDYENRIDDLMLFFYQAEKQSNASADTPIDKIFYFDRDKLEGDNRTEPVQVNLPAGEYDLLVVTNTGDMRAQLQGKTLGGVRDYILTQAWTENEGDYSRFVMTSDGHTADRVTLCGNPKNEPANAVVEVERVAARIDYRAKAAIFDVNDHVYGKAKASLVGAVVLNKMAEGSYLLKRTAMPDNGALTSASPVTYLGDELPVEGGVQQNYVVDPWSLKKTASPVNSSLASLYDNYYTSFDKKQSAWEAVVRTGKQVGDWRILDYTLENTMSREAQLDAYRTMVVFQVRYIPNGYTEGETFYRVKNKIYPTRAEAEAAAEGTGALVREFHNGLCYYVWRVRHSNDDNDGAKGIMEYAIVRNNIYRLLVSSIYGLGDEVPFPDPDGEDPVDPNPDPDPDPNPDPDSDPNPDPDPGPDPDPDPDPDPNIEIIVTVEDWTQMKGEDIYL